MEPVGHYPTGTAILGEKGTSFKCADAMQLTCN